MHIRLGKLYGTFIQLQDRTFNYVYIELDGQRRVTFDAFLYYAFDIEAVHCVCPTSRQGSYVCVSLRERDAPRGFELYF